MALILDGTSGLFGNVTGGDISGNFTGGNSSATTVTATGSTTARSLANRFADMANVKDFGAVGDGVTDDTNAFVAAMDSGKDVIFVPSGTYNLVGNAYRAQGKLWIASPNTIYKNPTYPLGFKASSIWWGRVIQGAPYGPICIANLLKTPNEAGEALGLRLACNDFPPLTPGANNRVMLSSLVDNVDVPAGTLEVWAGNFVSNQIPGNSETRMIGIEVEVSRDMGNNTDASSNPWGGFNSNGIEVTGMAVSPTGGKPTCAMRTWVNGSTGQNWFQHGIAISRTTTWGILFKQNPSGGVDTGTFLGGGTTVGACLRVEGNATNIISSTGNHVNIIDLSSNTGGIGTFVRMPTNATSTASFRNFANFDSRIDISSGDTISQQSSLFFSHAGTAKWQIGKLSDNRFFIYGNTNAVTPIIINELGQIQMNNLPTSSAGLPSGSLWINGTAINIVP
jgi:hypothetical protein